MVKKLILVGLIAAMPGCGNLVPSTLLEINALDPFSADPAGFAVGIDNADGLSLIPGTVTWTFEAVHSPSGDVRNIEIILLEDRTQDDLTLYTLADDDVTALREWQQNLRELKETSDGNSSLDFSINLQGCRIPGVEIPDDPRISVFVQLEENGRLRPLARNVPVMDFFGTDRQSIENLPLC